MKSHFGECFDCSEPDGGQGKARWHHRLRQSFLKEGDLCAERARRAHANPELRRETDAACVGTAVHKAIEYTIDCDLALVDAIEVMEGTFAELTELPNFVWVKYNAKAANNWGRKCITNWYREVYPTLDRTPGATVLEQEFTLPLIDDATRLVEVNGTIDYFGADGLKDWKTSSREYIPWEHRRWDTQATIYTYAAWGLQWRTVQPVEFELVIMHPQGVQRLMLERTTADWDWLAQRAEALSVLIEAELPLWPKNDNHALCSSKWCDAFAVCKGQAVGVPWPK